MYLDFNLTDVVHRIIAKLVPAFLPGAKKKYNAKAVFQSELDIHGVASKASLYNISTPPKVIEEGFLAAEKLIMYLVADNYRFKSSLFRLSIRIPGEYDGTETALPEGVYPEAKLTVSEPLRNYVRDNVEVVFDGVEDSNGFIGEVLDEATGSVDEFITPGNIVSLHGYGLKLESNPQYPSPTGAFLVDSEGVETPVKAIAHNTQRMLKLLMPEPLPAGEAYTILIRTQSAFKGHGVAAKRVREIRTMFSVQVQ
ncbi:MAG: DUF4469 domain-containing protein [Prevotellaceae bacterium]|jgi:hypothetical protein|nr:DUF4469 domain-containing protein [Prevotellaceae bacterium]